MSEKVEGMAREMDGRVQEAIGEARDASCVRSAVQVAPDGATTHLGSDLPATSRAPLQAGAGSSPCK